MTRYIAAIAGTILAGVLCTELAGQVSVAPFTTLSPPSWVFPTALLDLNFASDTYYNATGSNSYRSLFTTTRASAETCSTANGRLFYVASNVPCITDLGLASWATKTNLILQSNFAATWTATRSTLTANAVASPDTTTDAASLVEDATATSTHVATQSVTKAASGIAYACSVYAKANTRTRVDVELQDGSGNGVIAVFDLAGGQVGVAASGEGTPFTTLSQSISPAFNGFYRLAVMGTSNTATTIQCNHYLDSGSGTAAISNSYSGDGTSGAYLFGAQLEAGTYPSPLIPTTTIAVARSADVSTLALTTLGAFWTIFGAGIPSAPAAFATSQNIISLDNATLTDRASLARASGLNAQNMTSGNVGQSLVGLATTAWTQNVYGKVAMSMSAAAQRMGINSTISSGVAALTLPTITTVHVGSRSDSLAQWEGTISRVAIFNNNTVNVGAITCGC